MIEETDLTPAAVERFWTDVQDGESKTFTLPAGVLHERATLMPISVECTIPDCPRCRGNWRVLMPPGGEPAPRAHFEFRQGRRYVTEWEVLP